MAWPTMTYSGRGDLIAPRPLAQAVCRRGPLMALGSSMAWPRLLCRARHGGRGPRRDRRRASGASGGGALVERERGWSAEDAMRRRALAMRRSPLTAARAPSKCEGSRGRRVGARLARSACGRPAAAHGLARGAGGPPESCSGRISHRSRPGRHWAGLRWWQTEGAVQQPRPRKNWVRAVVASVLAWR